MIPVDSPVGQKLISEQKTTLGTDPVASYQVENQKETAKKTKLATIVIGSVVVLVIISAIIGQDDASEIAAPTPSATPTPSVPAESATQPSQYTFDIPSLIGKNIDEVRKVLGKSTSQNLEAPKSILDKQKQFGDSYVMETWDNTFESNGLEMSVEFYIKDRSVKEFFVEANDPSGKTKNKQRLLLMGNLSENDSRYSIEFVKTKVDPSSFTGVIVTPKK